MRSLERRDATCTSRVRPVPSQLVRHTSLMICSRRKTTPGRWASSARRSNSLRVSWTTEPSTLTWRVGSSMRTGPRCRAVSHGRRPVSSANGAPADGVDTGEQFTGVVRLHHVVVGAEVEAVDPGTYVGARGHHDHRDGGALADLAAHLVAVLVGQAQVEQHHSEAGAPSGTSAWSASSPLRACVTSKPWRARTADRAAATWLSSSTRSSLIPAPFGSSAVQSRRVEMGTRACTMEVTPMHKLTASRGFVVAAGFRYAAGTRPGRRPFTTSVRLLPDRYAQFPLRCNDAGRAGSLLSSATEEDGARGR